MEAAPSRYPAVGEVIDGKYRIDRLLGQGGMGAVMAAYHTILRAPVALKFISPDMLRVPGAVERFLNEGVAARNIHSDHVVRIDDVGRLPSGLPYIVMEMLSGCDLDALLAQEGGRGLPAARAVHFVLQILRGLQVAHASGVIHRDLKPSNAFVITRDGEPDFVKLLDFGISKIKQEDDEAQHLTQTNTGLGTPLYMSPEQARNARGATPQSDLYSVAAMLYELLAGRTPYQADTANDLLYKLFTSEPDPLANLRPDLPPALCALVHQGLSKDPAARPPSALAFAELLVPFSDARSSRIVERMFASGAATSLAPSSLVAPAARASMPPTRAPIVLPSLGATEVSVGGDTHPQLPPSPPPRRALVFVGLAVTVLVVSMGAGAWLSRSDASTPSATSNLPPTPPSATANATPSSSFVAAPGVSAPVSASPSASAAPSAPPPPTSSASPRPTQRPTSAPAAATTAQPQQKAAPQNPFSVGITR